MPRVFSTVNNLFSNELFSLNIWLHSFAGGILDLKPEALQTALNVTAVGALVASQEVNVDK